MSKTLNIQNIIPAKIIKVFIPLNIKNKNGRIYTKQELEPHIQEFLKRKQTLGVVYGEFDHPDSLDTTLSRVSHTVENVWFDNDKLMGEIKIIPTYRGKELQELIKDGCEFVVRPRSAGNVDDMGYVHIKKLFTFDVYPIEKDAFYSLSEIRKIKLNRLRQKQEEQGVLAENYNSVFDVEEDEILKK